MKMQFKMLSFMIVICLVLTAFVACGDEKKGDTASSSEDLSLPSVESVDDASADASDESSVGEESEDVVEFDALKGAWEGIYMPDSVDGSEFYGNLLNVSMDGKGNGVENFSLGSGEAREFMYSVMNDKVAFVYPDTADVVEYQFIRFEDLLVLEGIGDSLNFVLEDTEDPLAPEVDSDLLGEWYRFDGDILDVIEFNDDFWFYETYGEAEDAGIYHTYNDGTLYFEFGVRYDYEISGNKLFVSGSGNTVLEYTRLEGDISEVLGNSIIGSWVASDETGVMYFTFYADGTGYVEMAGELVNTSYELKDGNGINITMHVADYSETLLEGFYEISGDTLVLTDGVYPLTLTREGVGEESDEDYDLTPAENVPDTIYGMWACPMEEEGLSYTLVYALRQDGTGFTTAKDIVAADYELSEEEIAMCIDYLTYGFTFTVEGNTVTLFLDGEETGVANMIVDKDDMIVVPQPPEEGNEVMYFTRIVE